MFSSDRYEMTPERRKKIHEHRKKADLYGPELPFQIGGFKKKLGNKVKDVLVSCSCGKVMSVSRITVSVVCPSCGTLISVGE